MRRILGLFLFFYFTNQSVAQEVHFPKDWLGSWSGKLDIYSGQNVVQQVSMRLNIHPTDRDSVWTWNICYGEDTIKGLRAYEIKVLNGEKGHYLIDEKNSILIDAFVQGNILISHFEVQSSHITSIYRRQDDELIFEIIVHKGDAIRSTGGTVVSGEEIPPVQAYQITGYQRAILKKY
jgi:hypothetical protein